MKSGYDLSNRPRKKVIWRSGQHHYTGEVDYDTCGRLSVFREQVGAGRTAYETTFSYDNEDKPTAVCFGSDTRKLTYAYDALGRLTTQALQLTGSVPTTYTYLAGANGGTTPLIQKITQKGVTRTFSYDACGNITQVKTGTLYTKYTYDKIGQLTRVNDQTDTSADATGTTWVYTYDVGGNIKTKKAYAYTTGSVTGLTPIETHTYTYGNTNWRDQLTKFDGVTITYDAIGNPTNDGTWQYTWQQGRQLAQMSKTGETVSFLYNADGLRVQKTSTTKGTTKYTLHGKNIVHITNANNSIDMHFYYGANGRPAVVMYNNVAYGYLYNLQGDVVVSGQ